MSVTEKFSGTVEHSGERGTGAFIVVPNAVMKAFAPRKRVPVKATVERYTYRTTICDMGSGPMIGLRKSVCEEAGIAPGDNVQVVLELDEELRTVAVPRDLQSAMNAAERAAFATMSFTHRREYVEAIESAKRPETRVKRVALAVEAARKRIR